MPEGVVQSLDPEQDRAIVVRDARTFPARLADLEPAARHPGAHVHFDIKRDGGVDRAVEVSLRRGTRVNPRHRRFGTATGSRRADVKGSTPIPHPRTELGLSRDPHPLEVAAAWARSIEAGDEAAAVLFYVPDAVVHTPDGDQTGQPRIERWLREADLPAGRRAAEVSGLDGEIMVRWPAEATAEAGWDVRNRVHDGLVTEQWISREPVERAPVEVTTAAGSTPMEITTRGRVEDDDVAYALKTVGAVLHRVSAPILFSRLKLDNAPDPARPRPAIAQVSLDLDGEPVRAQVAGHYMREAADLLARRLADRLDHRAQRMEDLHQRGPGGQPGEWRHGDLPAVRPGYFDRPPESRQLVRHKSFAVGEVTPDEAVFDMEMADYDFYLFRDLASGEDSLIERQPDGSYRLTRLRPGTVVDQPTAVPFTVSDQVPPQLSLDQALERLDAAGEDRVFFANSETGRGSVAYRRYDGHYGLITTE